MSSSSRPKVGAGLIEIAGSSSYDGLTRMEVGVGGTVEGPTGASEGCALRSVSTISSIQC